MLAARARSSVG